MDGTNDSLLAGILHFINPHENHSEVDEEEFHEEEDPAYHGPDIQKPYKDFYRR